MKIPFLFLQCTLVWIGGVLFHHCDALTAKTAPRLSSLRVSSKSRHSFFLSSPDPPQQQPRREIQTWNHHHHQQQLPAVATSATSLQLFPSSAVVVPSALGSSRVLLRAAVALLGGLLTVLLLMRNNNNKVQRLLYPSMVADKMYSEPLPPSAGSSLGCPLLGTPPFIGSRDWGAGSWYRKVSQRLGPQVSMFKYMLFNKPVVAVAGARNVKHVLSQEFEPRGLKTVGRGGSDNTEDKPSFQTSSSLIMEQDKQQHSFLRRLVGQAITPAAVAKSIPNLQAAAEVCVDKMLNNNNAIKMESICTEFTLDVAWKQILGLNLSSQAEIDQFHKAVDDWIGGIMSVQAILGIGVANTPGYKAKEWLEHKIEEKIDELESQQCHDSSTLSGMVFASDDDGGGGGGGGIEDNDGVNNKNRKLTRQQIIDNAMLLILAGSETSASTLTNCMLLLGLHKEAWNKLVKEQQALQAKYDDVLSKDILDKECPYLEGVIKESMRLRPIVGGITRVAKETMIVDGKQIPKGWLVDWSVMLTHELDPKTYKEDGSHMDVKKGFVPERWLDVDTTPSDFLPMGAGPRYCLGANLAYAEMKVFLATLARKMDFELTGNTEVLKWKRMSIIPKVVDGVPVKVQARDPSPATVWA